MSVLAIAEAHGLLGSKRNRGYCPHGCDDGRRETDLGCSLAPRRFYCHRCGAGGGRRAYIEALRASGRLHLDLVPDLAEAPATQPRTEAARLNVPRGWAALRAEPAAWAHKVQTWCEARGAHPDLVRLTKASPHVAAALDSTRDLGAAALSGRARKVKRELLIALRDRDGVPRTLDRRPLAGAPSDGLPKALRLSSRDTGNSSSWGGFTCFGALPDLEAALREPGPVRVFIGEGGPDFLFLEAVARTCGGVAFAAPSATALPKLAHELANLARRLGAEARVRFVVVPHLGDTPTARFPCGVGEAMGAEAASSLTGAGRVQVARVPVGADGKGDFGDLVATGLAPSDLLAFLEAAPVVADVVRVADAEAEIYRELERAVADAVANVELLPVLSPTGGSGKSRALAAKLRAEAAEGWAGVLLAPTHDVAAELLPDGIPVEGLARGCLEVRAHEAAGRTAQARSLSADLTRYGRKGACSACTREECPVREPTILQAGKLYRGPHAALSSLRAGEGVKVLIGLDELPPTSRGQTVEAADLHKLAVGGVEKRWGSWRPEHPATGAAALDLINLGSKLSRAHYAEGTRYPTHYREAGLEAVLREAELDLVAWGAVLAEPAGVPSPTPAAMLAGRGYLYPKAEPVELVRAVAAALSGDATALRGWNLAVGADAARWTRIEAVLCSEAAKQSAMVATDATAEASRGRWAAVAQALGKNPEIRPIHVVSDHATPAVHLRAAGFAKGRMLLEGRWQKRALGPWSKALAELNRQVGAATRHLDRAPRVALMLPKFMADVVRDGGGSDHVAAEAARMAAAVFAPWILEIGHYGRDDKGSNRFEACDVLVAFDWCPNPQEVASEAAALGQAISAREIRDSARKQALLRARHLRHRVTLIFIGGEPPAGPELPGVAWRVVALDSTAHAPKAAAAATFAAELRALADQAGRIVQADALELAHELGLGERAAVTLIGAEAEYRGWSRGLEPSGPRGGRPRVTYAPFAEAAIREVASANPPVERFSALLAEEHSPEAPAPPAEPPVPSSKSAENPDLRGSAPEVWGAKPSRADLVAALDRLDRDPYLLASPGLEAVAVELLARGWATALGEGWAVTLGGRRATRPPAFVGGLASPMPRRSP